MNLRDLGSRPSDSSQTSLLTDKIYLVDAVGIEPTEPYRQQGYSLLRYHVRYTHPLLIWQANKESNPSLLVWSQECYHYTIDLWWRDSDSNRGIQTYEACALPLGDPALFGSQSRIRTYDILLNRQAFIPLNYLGIYT